MNVKYSNIIVFAVISITTKNKSGKTILDLTARESPGLTSAARQLS